MSVREISGQKIIKKILEKDVPVVLDPTLLLERNYWDRLLKEATVCIPKQPYCFCYFLGNNKKHRESVKHLSQHKDYKIVNLQHFSGFCEADVDFADENLYAVSPKKCLKFEKDVLGFRRVQMAMEEDCVSCGKCSSVCPISSCNKETDNVFRRFYGQIKNNKILMESSSGGAFSAISELWIKNGGVVWGGYQLMKMQKQALYVLTELIIFIKYVDLNM